MDLESLKLNFPKSNNRQQTLSNQRTRKITKHHQTQRPRQEKQRIRGKHSLGASSPPPETFVVAAWV